MLKFLPFRSFSKSQLFFRLRTPFATSPEEPKPKKKLTEDEKRSQFEAFTDSFFEVLKKEKAPSTKKGIDYTYNSRVIYSNNVDQKILSSNTRSRFLIGALWTCLGYASFAYIHPLVTIIPAWFASGSFLAYFLANNYAKKLVYQINISEDQKSLEIMVAKGKNKEIKAKIEDMDLFDIIELKDRKGKKESENQEKLSNNFVAVFDVRDEKGKNYNELRLFIESQNIKVENMDLFKFVLIGNQAEVDKFRFVSEKEKVRELEKENKEMDRKIEEEFERIKKETEVAEEKK